MDYRESEQYKKVVAKAIEGAKGEAGKLAEILNSKEFGNEHSRHAELKELLSSFGSTAEEIFRKGPYELYRLAHGKEIADKALQLAIHMPKYAYSSSVYRRSFRTEDANAFLSHLADLVSVIYFPWKTWFAEAALTSPRNEYGSSLISTYFLSNFIALEIDAGNKSIIQAVENACLGDNNTNRLDDAIFLGMVKSSDASMHKMLCDLLLAARLQEGLRQAILENADMGTTTALRVLMQTVLDHDLLRFSSAVRAVGTWMGQGFYFDDKRAAEKLLKRGLFYMDNPKERQKAMESPDVLELYAALWATAVFEVNDVLPLLTSMLKGKPYQQLTALYFAEQTEHRTLQRKVALLAMESDDFDVLAYAMSNLHIDFGWPSTVELFQKKCRYNRILEDVAIRKNLFSRMLEIAPKVSKNGHHVNGKPFGWAYAELKREEIFSILLVVAGYDFDSKKIATLLDFMNFCDSNNRIQYLKFFQTPPKDEAGRTFLLASLSDKSMPVRKEALKAMKSITPNDEEIGKMMDLLGLKTGDLRQNAVEILLSLPDEKPMDAAKKLLSDKSENKRLAGLDMLDRMVKAESLERTALPEILSLMPKVTPAEQVLVDGLTGGSSGQYNAENGFGLYDPNYRPDLPLFEPDSRYTAKKVFGFKQKRMRDLFATLCKCIEDNRDYTYKVKTWDEGSEDVVLGTLRWPQYPFGAGDKDTSGLDHFVLPEVWRSWLKENKVTCEEMLVLIFTKRMQDHEGGYRPGYEGWVLKLLDKNLNAKEIDSLSTYCMDKEYSHLAFSILNSILWETFPVSERLDLSASVLADLLRTISEKDWKQFAVDVSSFRVSRPIKFAEIREVLFFHNMMQPCEDDERFKRYLTTGFELGRLAGLFYKDLEITDIARGVLLGLLHEDALYRAIMVPGYRYLANYSRKVTWRQLDDIQKYPVIKEVVERISARVIEIELGRGDSQTEVSEFASQIRFHEGAENFASILVAMGTETIYRGYVYNATTKKEVLSSLLKASHPAKGDNTETLREALDGRISDRRLLEAALYAPAWLNIVADLLGWKGLHSAAWYFHAHINESFSAEKETEVARYSPVSPQDFNDGAFDVDWFREAYKGLGAERFQILYECAKYITDGANHRRAQLFADAALGKLDLKTLTKEIRDKRNKDKLLSYALVPLKRNKMKDALERYEFIQEFLRESKAFGSMRQESEKKAASIALENLARNAGFTDTLRFSWRMETLKIKELEAWFTPRPCGDTFIHIVFDDGGVPTLVCEKGGKRLASVPTRLKKELVLVEGRAIVASLKAQYKRARLNLEQAMVNRDAFEYNELAQLMGHPVIAPLLKGLLFASDGKIGYFEEWEGAPSEEKLAIAHPYDLYTAGVWRERQKEAFERRLVQPFKQIFRELYLLNEDELAEKNQSRRYAGHQVQPQKTVALLKTRGWTVDYEAGLQRVYYRENIIAEMYAAADWFSPADIEAPTLEVVRFFDRKTGKTLLLDALPPVLFSEVMRDIDLVVSVAHVGGVDPEASHSTVEMRTAIVRELLALLKVGNVTVQGRHATVLGSLGEYTVHLGSGVVHQMGRGAIHILAVPSQHRGRVFLPFADDDPRTAEILSKILLLADDEKIKDPAILNQIR